MPFTFLTSKNAELGAIYEFKLMNSGLMGFEEVDLIDFEKNGIKSV